MAIGRRKRHGGSLALSPEGSTEVSARDAPPAHAKRQGDGPPTGFRQARLGRRDLHVHELDLEVLVLLLAGLPAALDGLRLRLWNVEVLYLTLVARVLFGHRSSSSGGSPRLCRA